MNIPIGQIEPVGGATAAGGASVWSRLLLPSLSDLFFLFAIAWMFLASPVGWSRLLLDADTTLHIRVGQTILETGAVPSTDPFAFSKPGETWYAFEWLTEAAMAVVYRAAGFKGIAYAAGMLIALYVTALLKYTLWRGANGLVAMVLTLMAATATTIHFHARPHLITLLFLAVAIWILEYNRRSGGRLLWALVPLTILWANLHGGFVIFFVLLALRFAGCAAEAWLWEDLRTERRREATQLFKLGIACGLASLINPYGVHLHLHILETLRSTWIMTNVSEFQSPKFRGEEIYTFMALLFAGLAALVPLVRNRRIVEPLWLLFLAYAALSSVRHTTIFVLAAAPVIAVELSQWWQSEAARHARTSIFAALYDMSVGFSSRMRGTSIFIPVTMGALLLIPGVQWPKEFAGEDVPLKLVQKHRDLLAAGRLYAPDQVADYLVFQNPEQKVFFDSRHNYYGEKIGNDYIAISSGAAGWRELLDKYRIDMLLAEANAPIGSLLKMAGEWEMVDHDKKFVLFTRRP